MKKYIGLSAATIASIILSSNLAAVSGDELIKPVTQEAKTSEIQPMADHNDFVTMNSIQFDNPAFNYGILQIKQGESITANATISYTGPTYLNADDLALHVMSGGSFIALSGITVDGVNHTIHFSVTVMIPEDYQLGVASYSIDVWDTDHSDNMVVERYSFTKEIEVQENAQPDPDPTPDPEPTPDPTPEPDPQPTPDPEPKPLPEDSNGGPSESIPSDGQTSGDISNVDTGGIGKTGDIKLPEESVKLDPVVKKADMLPATGDNSALEIGESIIGLVMITGAVVLVLKKKGGM